MTASAKAAIFRHADSHLEQNSKYVRETGKEAKPCTANMVNDPYSKSAGHSNTHSATLQQIVIVMLKQRTHGQ